MSKISHSSEDIGLKKRKRSISRRRQFGGPENKIASVSKFLKGKYQHIKTR